MKQRIAIAAVATVLIAGFAGVLYFQRSDRAEETAAAVPSGEPTSQRSRQGQPALYCQFYVFVESRPFVAFLFEQDGGDKAAYRQIYVAKADGDQTDYNAAVGRQPEWRLDPAAQPPRLEGRVTVPTSDQAGLGEQDIAIEIHGFDMSATDKGWREASLKSAYYQNLSGKCRRAAA